MITILLLLACSSNPVLECEDALTDCCTKDSQCADVYGGLPYCLGVNEGTICAECMADADCGGEFPRCLPDPYIGAWCAPEVISCETGDDCPLAEPYCWTSLHGTGSCRPVPNTLPME